MPHAGQEVARILIELGAAVVGLAVLARLAGRWGFSSIPLYLLAGLAFGHGGLLPLNVSQGFTHLGAEIGVILLLFGLGLEYTGEELGATLRTGVPSALADFALNFTPGAVTAWLLGWGPLAAVVLGGVTWISSSGVIAKILGELGWTNNPETSTVLTVLILEDLSMAIYLPVISVLLAGHSLASGLPAVLVALGSIALVLFVALRYGKAISRIAFSPSDEITILTVFGVVLLVAGLAQRLQISAAVGAFLVGIAMSGTMAEKAHRLVAPLRDLFAAMFFFFFGLQIDPATLPPVLWLGFGLATITALTKMLTGWWAARRAGVDARSRWRAGATLVPRGEFSIVIAGLGVGAGLNPRLGALSAAYVLLLAIAGPILVRAIGGRPRSESN